jgi:DNA-binding FadR family transcriptional regulator
MPRRRHQDVVEALLDQIVAGDFAPGDRLPKEVVVAELYGVNRGTAREALRALEERRVAIVKHGRGSIVQPSTSWNVLDPAVAAALLRARGRASFGREIAHARLTVEPELAALAAEHAGRVDRAALAHAMQEDAPAGAFISELGRIARNRPLAAVAVALRSLAPLPEPPEGALHEVLEGVIAGDPRRARAAMEDVVGRGPRIG